MSFWLKIIPGFFLTLIWLDFASVLTVESSCSGLFNSKNLMVLVFIKMTNQCKGKNAMKGLVERKVESCGDLSSSELFFRQIVTHLDEDG